jgi:hypothetical protein
MTDHDKDKHLDELLDSALSAYSSAEPGPGLETKILAQVREAASSKESPGRNWKWLWAGAVAAAAVLLAALLLGRHSQVVGPGNNIVHTAPPPVQPGPQVHKSMPASTGNARNHAPKMHVPLPQQNASLALNQRPSVFPTPTPLSEQEKLLLSYYAHTPREELIAQSHPEEPPNAGEDQSNIAIPEMIFVPQKSSNTR